MSNADQPTKPARIDARQDDLALLADAARILGTLLNRPSPDAVALLAAIDARLAAVTPAPTAIASGGKAERGAAAIFSVDVTRISYAVRALSITAHSPEEARRRALDVAGNYEFSEHHADYEADVAR